MLCKRECTITYQKKEEECWIMLYCRLLRRGVSYNIYYKLIVMRVGIV